MRPKPSVLNMAEEALIVNNFVENKLLLPKQPYHDDFLDVMACVFRFACWFGILGSKRLIWRLWSVAMLVILLYIQGIAIWKVIRALAGWAIDTAGNRSVTARFAGAIFYAISILSMILCSRLCLSWNELAAYWAQVERSMAMVVPTDKYLKRRMLKVICFMAIFCIIEHMMSVISLVGFDCPPEEILRRYTLTSHAFLFLRYEYADWMAVPIVIINTLATALWNYQDLILVLISMGLTSRYHRLNSCVAKVCSIEKINIKLDENNEILNVYTWRRIREAFVKQANLVRKMDKALGSIVILSSACNFYFICLQLFMLITQGNFVSNLRCMYFIVSLAWISIRVGSVVLTASDVNVHSKTALKYIYYCDADCYNVEMDRLQNQLAKDFVTLSGKGFFYLNKTILMQMAGSIITYELMLIQYDGGTSDATLIFNSTIGNITDLG